MLQVVFKNRTIYRKERQNKREAFLPLSLYSFLIHLSSFAHRCLSHVGAFVCLGLLGVFQVCPLMSASLCQPDALRDIPLSVSRMYVMILEYPISLAILAHRLYRNEQTSFSPVEQSLTTSNVLPSHNALATGRPTFATPTSTPPQSIRL